MGADVTFKAVLIYFVMFKSLRSVEVAIAVAATKPFDIAMRQQMPFEFVWPRKLTHAAQIIAKRTLKSLCQIMDQHMPAQSIFPLESGWAML